MGWENRHLYAFSTGSLCWSLPDPDLGLGDLGRALDRARHRSTAGPTSPEGAARLGRLTAREREAVELVAAGLPNKEVAFRLGISLRTVEGHRARAMRKLGVRTLPELVRLLLASDPDRRRDP